MNPKYVAALETQPPKPLGERVRKYNGFIFGEFGVGKTVAAISCSVKKCLIIYTDNGWESVFNHKDLVDKIVSVPYDGLSQITAIGEAIKEGVSVGGVDYSEIDLVIVDTVSQIQEEYLDWLMENYRFSGDARVKATPTLLGKREGLTELEITGLSDYHMVRNQMRHPIKSLVKCPANVIFIAHLREPNFMEQAKGKLVRRPAVTETVYKLIAREATFMALMEADGNKRTFSFVADRKTTAKSRIKELDNKKINAEELPILLKKWTGQ